jgi:primosomal protein N''
MDRWSREWQRGEQSRFLSEQQIEQIKAFERDAKDRGIKTPYSISTAERRQRAYAKKRQSEESEATDRDMSTMPLISPSLMAALPEETKEFINNVMNDPELSDDQKTELISKAMRGES